MSTWSGNAEYYLNRGRDSILEGNTTDGNYRNSLGVIIEMVISKQSKGTWPKDTLFFLRWICSNTIRLIPAKGNDSIEACRPSPCGPNSQCRELRDVGAICSCLPGFVGRAPNCRSECVVSSDCPLNKACVNQRCEDPCASEPCGENTNCHVNNHRPVCSCKPGYTGAPLTECSPIRMSCFVAQKSSISPCFLIIT